MDVFDKIKDHKQIDMFTLPQSICFGYHFLKPMFYYDYNDAEKLKYAIKKAAEQIEHFIRLIDYMADHGICAKMMVPVVGTYGLKPEPIDVEELKRFVTYHFRNKKPERIHLYYSIHDELMDIVERK